MRLLTLCVALLILGSCATTEKKAKNYYLGHKDQLAQLCLDCFSDKKEPTYKKGDTTIVRLDTIINLDTTITTLDCPDGTKLDCPPNTIKYINKYTHRTDSVFRDTWQTLAEKEVLKGRLKESNDKLILLTDKYTKEKEKSAGRLKWLLILIGLSATYFGFLFVKSRISKKLL